MKLISCHNNNLLAGHFGINKTCELVVKKYYLLISCKDIKAYIQGYDICLALKAVMYKSYNDLKSLLVWILC